MADTISTRQFPWWTAYRDRSNTSRFPWAAPRYRRSSRRMHCRGMHCHNDDLNISPRRSKELEPSSPRTNGKKCDGTARKSLTRVRTQKRRKRRKLRQFSHNQHESMDNLRERKKGERKLMLIVMRCDCDACDLHK